jgi:hypothetical protein
MGKLRRIDLAKYLDKEHFHARKAALKCVFENRYVAASIEKGSKKRLSSVACLWRNIH